MGSRDTSMFWYVGVGCAVAFVIGLLVRFGVL
jgi:hypothetical protein